MTAQTKPTPEQRVMAELSAQRNAAMDRAAQLGAELVATQEALAEAEAHIEELKAEQTVPWVPDGTLEPLNG